MSANASHVFTLVIIEQPAKLHRFRYLKEIKDGRMGSILHSRNSSKTPVKVRVTRNHYDVSSECRVKLICCTVFHDLMPHPFYLFGDNCNGGIFEKEITIPAGKSDCDVSLDRIGIVCTPKKQKKANGKTKTEAASDETADGGGYERRCQYFNLFNKPARKNPCQSKDVNQLKLVFQVLVESPVGTTTLVPQSEPVASEVIQDAKIYSEMIVDYVIPKIVTRWNQDVWLYMKDPLPGESATRFEVCVKTPKQGIGLLKLPASQVKKHLVVFNFKSLEGNLPEYLVVSVQVVDNETEDLSEPVNLQLQLPTNGTGEPASKQQRIDKAPDQLAEGDFLSYIVSGFTDDDNRYKVQGVQDDSSFLNNLDEAAEIIEIDGAKQFISAAAQSMPESLSL